MDTAIEERFAALEAGQKRAERRLKATWGLALCATVTAFALGWHKDAVA